MAQAGVSYTLGREGDSKYGEPLAGVREKTPYHQFLFDVPALDAQGKPLPELTIERPGAPGRNREAKGQDHGDGDEEGGRRGAEREPNHATARRRR